MPRCICIYPDKVVHGYADAHAHDHRLIIPRCSPHLDQSPLCLACFPFSCLPLFTPTSSDKRQLREHGMKFLPLVSVGTLYLAYESANFGPISLQIAAAIWPGIPKPAPGLQAPYVSRIVTGCTARSCRQQASGEALPLVRVSSCYWRHRRFYPAHFRRQSRRLQENDVRKRM